MAKHIESIESLFVALELLRQIPRQRKVTAKDLHRLLAARGLNRSERTIQRLMAQLSDHFDIERDERSRPFGYRWSEKAKGWSIPMLTLQESLLLLLAERHLKNILPPNVWQSMGSFFQQAQKNLPYSDNPALEREWLEKVRVVDSTQPLIPAKIDADIFHTTTEALYQNRMLKINYKNADGKVKDYEVMPLGLAQQGPRLYLVCRFSGHENERSLAMHRIKKAKVVGLPFKRPKEFNLQKFEDDGRFGIGEGVTIRLTFTISKKSGAHLLETPLSKDQRLEVDEQHGTMKVTATVIDTKQLQWWLNGFGDQVREIHKEIVSQ